MEDLEVYYKVKHYSKERYIYAPYTCINGHETTSTALYSEPLQLNTLPYPLICQAQVGYLLGPSHSKD
jgi:hypothetical protein